MSEAFLNAECSESARRVVTWGGPLRNSVVVSVWDINCCVLIGKFPGFSGPEENGEGSIYQWMSNVCLESLRSSGKA